MGGHLREETGRHSKETQQALAGRGCAGGSRQHPAPPWSGTGRGAGGGVGGGVGGWLPELTASHAVGAPGRGPQQPARLRPREMLPVEPSLRGFH